MFFKPKHEQIIIDEASTTVTYIGYAESLVGYDKPLWAIKKIESASASSPSGITTIKWATSYRSYGHIWNDRASLSYVA